MSKPTQVVYRRGNILRFFAVTGSEQGETFQPDYIGFSPEGLFAINTVRP